MKYIITGGNGFLGKELVKKLLSDNHEVNVIGRSPTTDFKGVNFIKADITDRSSLKKWLDSLKGADVLIHLAALVPKEKDQDQSQVTVDVNITGTVNLLEVFGEHIKKFIYASTAEVYGLPKNSKPLSEDYYPDPLSYYGASKLAGELYCYVYSQKHNLSTSVLRFTVLYGPGDTINRAVPNFIKNALEGKKINVFGGEELRDYLHVKDAAEAVYLAANSDEEGVFNIGTGKGISVKDAAQAIINAINPRLGLNILDREKKAADIVLDIQKAQKQLKFNPHYIFPDLIEEQIKWQQDHENLF